MTDYIALFRGINVGGRHSLPMQELRHMLAALGCEDVKTYIQSGNAVFRSAADSESLADEIKAEVDREFGFAPRVLLLTVEQFSAIAAANPYTEAEQTPRFLHIWFLAGFPGNPNLEALDAVQSASESYKLGPRALYLHAPDGIGRSKLAQRVEKCLGVEATARNWRTVSKLLELATTFISQ